MTGGSKRAIAGCMQPKVSYPSWNTRYMMHKSTNKTVYSTRYHVVWCQKCRRQVLGGGVDERLKEIIDEVWAEVAAKVIEVGVIRDQVHLLAEVVATVPLSQLS